MRAVEFSVKRINSENILVHKLNDIVNLMSRCNKKKKLKKLIFTRSRIAFKNIIE